MKMRKDEVVKISKKYHITNYARNCRVTQNLIYLLLSFYQVKFPLIQIFDDVLF